MDALDLVFQGSNCWNKGITTEHMAQARRFFERALTLDPRNIEALVGIAAVDGISASLFMVNDRDARLAAAEATLIEALSMSPQHARGHMFLGAVQFVTKRAAQGIRECERALALDRNLADAHGLIGCAKVFIGRSEETEAHVQEAFRLSPRDTAAFRWMHYASIAKLHLGADAEAVTWLRRCLEANRNYPIAHFQLAAALALLGSLEEARDAVRAGLALHPTFTLRRTRGRMSDDPTYVAGSKRIREGMRMAGVPEE
jgi:tetratricopeptide (TPR) repeat protein